ncbi:uncharacterized protein BDZ99DRAFT_471211 [Mytilinidion resinicola]|uniref:Uncharacterized protein n=1 Tax=Mytilinidion resinicola TaxID=574789 RepID=A0A6A6Z428_9PEZI|nr:uncharacterized protein BDZ99DRAFT_471211 [Mytilinidion resinicola]KAF2815901.1 hypothetical protein BDZ99DRAFT_471211 [Mytilinidion resinicola]
MPLTIMSDVVREVANGVFWTGSDSVAIKRVFQKAEDEHRRQMPWFNDLLARVEHETASPEDDTLHTCFHNLLLAASQGYRQAIAVAMQIARGQPADIEVDIEAAEKDNRARALLSLHTQLSGLVYKMVEEEHLGLGDVLLDIDIHCEMITNGTLYRTWEEDVGQPFAVMVLHTVLRCDWNVDDVVEKVREYLDTLRPFVV